MTAVLEGLWTAADSEALDLYAEEHYNTPLTPDPKLWALLETDRTEAPYLSDVKPLHPGLKGNRMPSHCHECRRRLRSRRTMAADAPPGAVAHCGQGLCDRCYGVIHGQNRRKK